MGKLHSFLIRRLMGRLHLGPDVVRHLTAFQRLGEVLDVAPPLEMAPVGLRTAFRAFRTRAAVQIRPGWLWPWWMRRQLDPSRAEFIPRGHLPFLSNVTARNWTMLGVPQSPWEAIVDPRGLTTPWFDGWSLDWWVGRGTWRFPSQADDARQRLVGAAPIVETTLALEDGDAAHLVYAVATDEGDEFVVAEVQNRSPSPCDVAFAVQPYNPEGLAVVESIAVEGSTVYIDGNPALFLPEPAGRTALATFRRGDAARLVTNGQFDAQTGGRVHDPAGIAGAAFVYPLPPGGTVRVAAALPPPEVRHRHRIRRVPAVDVGSLPDGDGVAAAWERSLERGMRIEVPDGRLQEAVDANRAYMLLFCDGDEITPGPHTYHRFWFRDAAYQIAALDRWGFEAEAAEILSSFPRRQRLDGFFYSQWREWDANGAAIWALAEHERLTGHKGLPPEVTDAVRSGADWIERRCRPRRGTPVEAEGLLPAGISAEHLGPHDFYYWDNLWALRGLLDAAALLQRAGNEADARRAEKAAGRLRASLLASFERASERIGARLIPAGPTRGADAAMIGSLAACYPLRLLDAHDPLITGTLDALCEGFCLGDAFFQGVSHTGLGTYLTLQLAFVELERGEARAWDRLAWLLEAATPTYTWPEAIHPRLGGGCMGDGHHGWAAADFLTLVRNILVREDGDGGLALMSLLPRGWRGKRVAVHDAPTHAGNISFELRWTDEAAEVEWSRDGAPVRMSAPALDPSWSTTRASGRHKFGKALVPGPIP